MVYRFIHINSHRYTKYKNVKVTSKITVNKYRSDCSHGMFKGAHTGQRSDQKAAAFPGILG